MTDEQPVPGIPGAVMRRVAALPPPDGLEIGPHVQARPGLMRFQVPGAGVFVARDGNLIEFVPDQDADPGLVALHLHGTARGALIHMRGELPLHAATYMPPRGTLAVAVCGSTGAGKSTLGMELSRRGWLLLADDTTRIVWDGQAVAWPSRDTVKLWRDACETVGLDARNLQRVARTMDKYYVAVPALDAPRPLGVIVELAGGEEKLSLAAGEGMALVTRNTYRPECILPLGMQKQHVEIAARVARSARIFQLPGKPYHSPAQLADILEERLGG